MSELEQNTVTEEAEKEASLGSKRKKNKKEKEKKPLWKEILSWIFTILGALMILGAGVMLFSRRRA